MCVCVCVLLPTTVKVVVLDRPNPVGGNSVEGPLLNVSCCSSRYGKVSVHFIVSDLCFFPATNSYWFTARSFVSAGVGNASHLRTSARAYHGRLRSRTVTASQWGSLRCCLTDSVSTGRSLLQMYVLTTDVKHAT